MGKGDLVCHWNNSLLPEAVLGWKRLRVAKRPGKLGWEQGAEGLLWRMSGISLLAVQVLDLRW